MVDQTTQQQVDPFPGMVTSRWHRSSSVTCLGILPLWQVTVLQSLLKRSIQDNRTQLLNYRNLRMEGTSHCFTVDWAEGHAPALKNEAVISRGSQMLERKKIVSFYVLVTHI